MMPEDRYAALTSGGHGTWLFAPASGAYVTNLKMAEQNAQAKALAEHTDVVIVQIISVVRFTSATTLERV